MITGSTKGLGQVAAEALAKAGANIAVCGRSAPDLERVTTAIGGLGRDAKGFSIEVTDKAKVSEAVAQILDYFDTMSGIDVENLDPTTHVFMKNNRTRPDKEKKSELKDRLLESAPALQDRFMTIPRIL